MGLLGNLKTTAAWAGSHGASRLSRTARTAKLGQAARRGPLPKRIPGGSRSLGGVVGGGGNARAGGWQIPAAVTPVGRNGKPLTGNAIPVHRRAQLRRATGAKRKEMLAAKNMFETMAGRPSYMSPAYMPPPPNPKGKSGFSHGKKLMYGAAGVGAMGLAWGVTQRNRSTDKTGYSQSRGIRNY